MTFASQIMVGCNREEFQCSRQHRVVVEYNKDPVDDHWELIYGRCVPGGVRQTSMQCGPYTFHEGTVYTAADTPSWTRITIPVPDRVFSRSALDLSSLKRSVFGFLMFINLLFTSFLSIFCLVPCT